MPKHNPRDLEAAFRPRPLGRDSSPRLGRRILVVEDDPQLNRVLGRLLSSFGHVVELCSCCRDARAQDARYALGVFDIDLPDGDGVALAWDLIESGTVGQAMFFTGSERPFELRRAEECGVVVRKARGVAVLRVAIESVIGDDVSLGRNVNVGA